jgi:hypothetical protein
MVHAPQPTVVIAASLSQTKILWVQTHRIFVITSFAKPV